MTATVAADHALYPPELRAHLATGRVRTVPQYAHGRDVEEIEP